jgi:hypothetical protein
MDHALPRGVVYAQSGFGEFLRQHIHNVIAAACMISAIRTFTGSSVSPTA